MSENTRDELLKKLLNLTKKTGEKNLGYQF